MLSLKIPCVVMRSGPSQRPRAVLWQVAEGDLQPAHPIAVIFPTSSKAIDAPPGTKLSSPRVVPYETELAITHCASRLSATPEIFGAVGHCRLLLVLSQLFVDHLFSPSHFISPCTFPMSVRRARSAAQLNVGTCLASVEVTETIQTYGARALRRPIVMGKPNSEAVSIPSGFDHIELGSMPT